MSNTSGGWRPDEQFGPLPPEYEAVHHEPRRPGPRRDPRDPRDQGGRPGPGPGGPGPGWQPRTGPQPAQRPAPGYQGQGYQGPAYQAQQRYDDPRYGSDGRFVPGFADPRDQGAQDYQDNQEYQEYQQWDDDRQDRPRKRSIIRRLAPWIAVAVIVTPIAYGGYYAYNLYQNKYHPADYAGNGTGEVTVQVKPGDTATSLAPALVALGVVASDRAFILAAEHSPNQAGMEPGFYRLHKQMKASLAYAVLSNPKDIEADKVTILEGLRVSQIIPRLVQADSAITAAEYAAALKNPALGLPGYAHASAEGFLFPATYQIPPNATALSVLQTMVQRYGQEASAISLSSSAQSVNLTPDEAVVVASLVQAEGGQLSDYPKIARVIYNRLAAGMKLQLDSTVFYGLGKYGTRATDAEIASKSLYNTYDHLGLPPGPIDSPGDAALRAALHPASGDWLYFVTIKPGVTKFTNSFTEFQQLEAQLNQNSKG